MPQLDRFPIRQFFLFSPDDELIQQRRISPLRVLGLAALMTQVLEEILNERVHD